MVVGSPGGVLESGEGIGVMALIYGLLWKEDRSSQEPSIKPTPGPN